MQKILQELEKLDLPEGKYAIYGSGPLAIRGIRETNDIDVIVKDEVYKKLKQEYGEKEDGEIILNNGEIEIFPTWNALVDDAEGMIDRAETIQGYKFVTLEDTIKWKKGMGRSKDKKDIELIKKYKGKE